MCLYSFRAKNKNLPYPQGAVFISSYNLQDRNFLGVTTSDIWKFTGQPLSHSLLTSLNRQSQHILGGIFSMTMVHVSYVQETSISSIVCTKIHSGATDYTTTFVMGWHFLLKHVITMVTKLLIRVCMGLFRIFEKIVNTDNLDN